MHKMEIWVPWIWRRTTTTTSLSFGCMVSLAKIGVFCQCFDKRKDNVCNGFFNLIVPPHRFHLHWHSAYWPPIMVGNLHGWPIKAPYIIFVTHATILRECKIFKKNSKARYILAEKKNNANTAALDVRTPNVTFYTVVIYAVANRAHLDIIQLIEFSEGVLLNLIGVLGLIGNTISITILSRWEKKR